MPTASGLETVRCRGRALRKQCSIGDFPSKDAPGNPEKEPSGPCRVHAQDKRETEKSDFRIGRSRRWDTSLHTARRKVNSQLTRKRKMAVLKFDRAWMENFRGYREASKKRMENNPSSSGWRQSTPTQTEKQNG